MTSPFSLDKLTIEEKVQVMEILWDELCAKADSVTSPAWHQTLLHERENALQIKEEAFMAWELAKQDIAKQIK
ncbi:MAG: addiction module protein [Gammaproteobacteria bacterium]|nr:addiction module protein [Gammaproteobacteria bacterium]